MKSPVVIAKRIDQLVKQNGIRRTVKICFNVLFGIDKNGQAAVITDPPVAAELSGLRPAIVNPINYKATPFLDYEWDINYPWYIRRIEGKRVLDAGFVQHTGFARILSAYNFEVIGVDLKPFNEVIPNLKTIKASIIDSGLPDNFCDCIIYNSLLEHLGLEHYEGKAGDNNHAQYRAMDEAYRLLNMNGIILLQVPYGRYPTVITYRSKPFYKIITAERLHTLLKNFRIEEVSYFAYEKPGWLEVSKTVADNICVGGSFPPCLALVKARKVS